MAAKPGDRLPCSFLPDTEMLTTREDSSQLTPSHSQQLPLLLLLLAPPLGHPAPREEVKLSTRAKKASRAWLSETEQEVVGVGCRRIRRKTRRRRRRRRCCKKTAAVAFIAVLLLLGSCSTGGGGRRRRRRRRRHRGLNVQRGLSIRNSNNNNDLSGSISCRSKKSKHEV
jgi:hypothetical protein